MAPFRDKFDFTDPKDYDKLADMAWMAASAVVRKREAELAKIPPDPIMFPEDAEDEIKKEVV